MKQDPLTEDCCKAQEPGPKPEGMACPGCGGRGRPVKAITLESLVRENARAGIQGLGSYRYCPDSSCVVVYFDSLGESRFLRADLLVRVGQTESASSHAICYCFDHSLEDIRTELSETGSCLIPDSIAAKCKQGLDRCEETNPQGVCCLGNVRAAIKQVMGELDSGNKERKS